MNVLIVEDDATQLEGIATIILANFQNTHCIKVKNYQNAIDIIDEKLKDIDLIILDIDLDSDDGRDGVDLGSYVRNVPNHKTTPILFITGYPEEAARAVHNTNCFDFLTKPLNKQELTAAIRKLININLLSEKPIRFRDVSGIYYRPLPSQIKYIKAMHRNIIVCTTEGEFTSNSAPLNKLIDELPASFIRCHRSYIVNTTYIHAFDRTNAYICLSGEGTLRIPVSRKLVNYISEIADNV